MKNILTNIDFVAMKRYHLIFVVASIAALFSCSKETASNVENEDIKEPSTGVTIPENPQTVTLSACFETDAPEVKTIRDGKKVLWESTDKIAVVAKYNDEVKLYHSEPAGEGGSSVKFKVDVDSGAELLYAIYPAELVKTVPVIGESSVTVPVPAVQDGSFANANITVAEIKGEGITFKNICNLVKFTTTSDITKAQLCVLDSRNLAGEAVVSFDESGISVTANATADRVTLENLEGAGTYYFATLPDETVWTGFGLRIGNDSGYKPGIIGSKPFPKNTRGTVTNVGTVDERIQEGDYNLTSGQADVLADLIASDKTSSTTRKNIAKAWRIHNKTINLAAGDYDMGKEIMVEFGGADEWVNVNIVGADSTSVNIVGGAAKSESRRIMEIGNKTRLSCKKITFKDAVASGTYGDGAGFMFQTYNSGISFESCRFTNFKNSTDRSGGVFKLQKPTVNFTKCTFDNNFARNGGVYFQYEGTANFTKCKFEDNTASNVGGVFSDTKGNSNFDGCVFKNCSALQGGAMASFDNSVNVTVKNSRFEACHSRKGGAIIAKKTSTTTLENVVFEGCYSDGTDTEPGGGALYILGEGSATINAKKCTFNGCYTLSGGEGGAYQLRAGTLNVEDSDFTGNYTTESKPGGVGHNWGSSAMSFTRCNFVGNISSKKAYQGTGGSTAGVHYAGTGATLKYTECVFDGNAASNASCFDVRADCYVAFDGCEFKNNEAGSNGVIKNPDDAAGIVLVNNCSFHHNNQRNDDNAQIFNGGKTGQFFCYNTTIYGNTQSGTVKRGSLISTLGSMAIVSSTLIANSSRSVIQQNKNWYNVVALIMNSILLNENESAQLLIFGTNETTPNMKNGGYNIVAPQDLSATRKFTLGETDVQNANMSYLVGGQFNAETGKYMWNGPSAEMSLAGVDAIKTFLNENLKPDNRNNNANIKGKTNLGAEFVAWLESIKAFDSRPQTGLWPGAYQNNQ